MKPSLSQLEMWCMGQTIRCLFLLEVCALTTVGDGVVKELSRIIQWNDLCE